MLHLDSPVFPCGSRLKDVTSTNWMPVTSPSRTRRPSARADVTGARLLSVPSGGQRPPRTAPPWRVGHTSHPQVGVPGLTIQSLPTAPAQAVSSFIAIYPVHFCSVHGVASSPYSPNVKSHSSGPRVHRGRFTHQANSLRPRLKKVKKESLQKCWSLAPLASGLSDRRPRPHRARHPCPGFPCSRSVVACRHGSRKRPQQRIVREGLAVPIHSTYGPLPAGGS